MSKTIQVEPARVKNKANDLKNLNTKLKNQITHLQSIERSLNGMWEGEAKNAFHKAFSQDIQQMTNFYKAIDQYQQKLNQIADAYEKAEKSNVQIANERTYH